MATFFCLFEQSGTFKKQFINLGHEAFDFDIQDEYGQTDHVCDLFNRDNIDTIICSAVRQKATLLMFFPCTYFSAMQILWTRGCNSAQKDWTNKERVSKSAMNIQKTAEFYEVFCYWVAKCVENHVPLIIENPYSPQSFLIRYFPLAPDIIDRDRRRFGDLFKKPTMWYFVNIKPRDNFSLLCPTLFGSTKLTSVSYGKKRSEISDSYAEHFIKTFIL